MHRLSAFTDAQAQIKSLSLTLGGVRLGKSKDVWENLRHILDKINITLVNLII